MDEDFELQYADELDAMDDFEPPGFSPQKFKRTLNFETPKNKTNSADDADNTGFTRDYLDKSPLTPLLGSPNTISGSLLHGSAKKSRLSDIVPERSKSEKRLRSPDEFTELSDDEFGDIPPPADIPLRKKARHNGLTSEEPTIDINPASSPTAEEKILLLRSKKSKNTTQERTNIETSQGYDFERQRIFNRRPAGDFITTTGMEGERVYIQVRDETTVDLEYEEVGKSVKRSQLLAVSIEDLKEQLEAERQEKLLEEAERLTQEIHRNTDDRLESDDEDDDMVDDSTSHSQLWVDRYTPRNYTDLLSEENINRTLLYWIKLWDYVVFNKEVPVNNKTKKNKAKEVKKKKWQAEVTEELDKHNRPVQKIALLNGPPGLGKTTLAHVIAKHAGYNVVEINASDDRSAETFKVKIEAATEMKSVLGAEEKPNCLIIDEIDGAPVAAINVLLNIIKRSDDQENKTKKKKEGDILRRPIICICNDQYVPSLRLLRQTGLVMNFPQTEPAKLASRLYEVTRHERLRADMNTLLALCDKTDNDIRSCLNTLQFLQRQGKELSLRMVQTLNVGNKDSQKSLFSVWYNIFSMPKPKRNRFLSIRDISNPEWNVSRNSLSARFQDVLKTTSAAGEYDKIMQGLFENYLECKFKDPKMHGLNFALDWMCFVDELNHYIGHKQDYSVMPYIPYVSVTFHLLCASNQVPKVQYPHSQYEAVTKLSKSTNLVTAMMTDMAPAVKKHLNQSTTVMEVLPPLLDIIQPTLRPVNTQLYSSREKEDLAQLIRIMCAYNMTYHQEKSPDGQYIYTLDPKVDEVVKFVGMKQQRQLTYAAKQLIAREIELEKMRKSEAGRGETSRKYMSESKSAVQDGKGNTAPHIPNHKQRLEAKPLTSKQEENIVRDFFGRIIKKKTPEAKTNAKEVVKAKKNVLNTDIWFHFKEGFSNAVRRNVKVQDFL